MRFILAAVTFVAVLYGNVSVQAENRVFIIANNPDGYGVDRCLSSGSTCGVAVATAYCKAREFSEAASFRRVQRGEMANSLVAMASSCTGGACDEFVAIECSR